MPKDWVPDVDIDLHINMTVAVSRYFPEPLLSIIQELILHRPNQQLRTMGHCMQYKYSVDLATVRGWFLLRTDSTPDIRPRVIHCNSGKCCCLPLHHLVIAVGPNSLCRHLVGGAIQYWKFRYLHYENYAGQLHSDLSVV